MRKTVVAQLIPRFMLLLIAGCASPSPVVDSPSSVPTHTKSPTSTVISTITPTLTVLSSRVEVTPVNTMTLEQQNNFVTEFLSDNGDCRLPCWWNITPGQKWKDAEKTIQGLGGVLVPGIPGYDPETTRNGTSIILKNVIPDATIGLDEKQGTVHAWHISSTGGVNNPENFRRFWKNYLVQEIVTMYGMPDRILVHASPASNSLQYGLYSLWLFYDELGFSILYEARIPMYFFDAPFFRICSETDPLLNIKLHTQSPNNPLPLDRFDRTLKEVRLGTDIGKVLVIRSLQEVTGLDETEIYNAFIQNERACFAVPSDIWRANP